MTTPAPSELTAAVKKLQPQLSTEQISRLEQFIDLLDKWNQTYNLTALRQKSLMVSHHILDSLSILPWVKKAKTVLDVGSGGGLPGIPLAIAEPDIHFTLVDANSKKTGFLTQAVIELGLKNVTVKQARIETLAGPKFDLIVSRAFAELSDFVVMTRHLLASHGSWLAMKGIYPYAEIDKLPPNVVLAGGERVKIPELEAERHVILLTPKRD